MRKGQPLSTPDQRALPTLHQQRPNLRKDETLVLQSQDSAGQHGEFEEERGEFCATSDKLHQETCEYHRGHPKEAETGYQGMGPE